MKRPSLDRSAKAVWLAIGVLVLAGLVFGAVAALVSYAASGLGGDAPSVASAAAASRDTPPLHAVRFGAPQEVPGTAWRLVEVRGDDREDEDEGYRSRRPSSLVNLIFLPPGGGEGRLLLDRPAFVSEVELPGTGEDSARAWITYRIAFRDTNGDALLTSIDSTVAYVSGLDGSGLRRVLPAPYDVRVTTRLAPGRMLVLALLPPADPDVPRERWPERAFTYDVATGRAEPYAALDSLATRASTLLPK